MRKNCKKEKVDRRQYTGMVFMMLIGAICGVMIGLYLDNMPEESSIHQVLLSYAGLFLGMYAAVLFHMIVHETGHLIFGLLTGYSFRSFRISSFMFLKENGRIKLKKLRIAGTGGQCLMIPPDMKEGKIPFVFYNLGGSFMNIIFGFLLLFGYLLFSDIPLFSPLLLIFSVVGFMTALMNGIPMRLGTVDNDGYNTLALFKNKEALEAFWIQLKVSDESSNGIRLKDMPNEWFIFPTDEAMKNSMVATRGVYTCNRLMDEERFEEADVLISHLLEIESGIVGLYHDLLLCDRIYLQLIGENRRGVIQDLLTKRQIKFMKAMKQFPSVIRTEYALALLYDNNAEKAEKIRNEFEKVAKTYPYLQDIESERDLMNIADRKLNFNQQGETK